MKISLKSLKTVIISGISFTLVSCIDQINVDLPTPSKVLVVNAILNPDSVFRVQVSRVASTTDSSSRLLSSASVYLLTPSRSAELLRNQGKGVYVSAKKPAIGVPYTLRAEADGYPDVTATDTVPAVVPIQEAWYSYPTGTDRNNEPLGTIVVRFQDPVRTADFYEIVAFQEEYSSLTGKSYQS